MGVLDILTAYHRPLLQGLLVTLHLASIAWVTGIVGGVLLGALADRYRRVVGIPVFVFALLLSATPLLVLLYWAHYPLQELLGQVIDPFITAAWVLTLVNLFAVTDTVKNTLAVFPEEYAVAARVCGLDARATFVHIKLPIICRQLIPVLLTLQVGVLQATLFASLISVEEIFRVAQQVNASTYRPIEIYTALALFFLVVCLPLNGLSLWLKHRFTRNLSEA
jgi:polar amino acid transport system permease protein